ncbi:hypothetical protein ACVBEG_27810 [Pseudomonas sp. GG8]
MLNRRVRSTAKADRAETCAQTIRLSADDGLRHQTDEEELARLTYKQWNWDGTATAGAVTDHAA